MYITKNSKDSLFYELSTLPNWCWVNDLTDFTILILKTALEYCTWIFLLKSYLLKLYSCKNGYKSDVYYDKSAAEGWPASWPVSVAV